MDNIISWIQKWYATQCNGDWEHSFGVTIDNVDNPGWRVSIDIDDTLIPYEDFEGKIQDKGDDDWYSLRIKDKKFIGVGDSNKLEFLLMAFRKYVEGDYKWESIE